MAFLFNEVEQALVSLVSPAVGSLANVYSGINSADKNLNAVICQADASSEAEEPKGTGNFWIDCAVIVKGSLMVDSDGVDPKPADITLADTAFNAVLQNNLDALLNAQGRTLTVFPNGCLFASPRYGVDQEGVFIAELPFKLYCCASVLPP